MNKINLKNEKISIPLWMMRKMSPSKITGPKCSQQSQRNTKIMNVECPKFNKNSLDKDLK